MSFVGDVGATRHGTISTGADATFSRNAIDARRMRRRTGSICIASARRAVGSSIRSRTACAMSSRLDASRTTRNDQGCVFEPLGALIAASRIFQIASSGTGSGLN
jgi:hypothetical protein